VALGRNALLLFVLSGLAARLLLLWRVPGPDGPIPAQRWVYEHAFAPLAAPRNASLLYAAANLVVLFVLLAWLHRRRWYWSV
jgi:predicted acyltransferase